MFLRFISFVFLFCLSLFSYSSDNEVMSDSCLTADQKELLQKYRAYDYVEPGESYIWVCVEDQKLRVIRDDEVLLEKSCSTSKYGEGSQSGSNKTPLGWHEVCQKIGAGARFGQVFRGRVPTDEVWKPGDESKEDLILTRILWLDGLEPGKNKGGNVDSKDRFIYIHGTNEEEKIGQKASHGCVRLLNDDVIELFHDTYIESCVLITLEE